jgi:glycosyltransferase involved in cell wall biosynthesis
MGSQALVSVVTPFYNTRSHLAECIESVLAQTHQNWEYILVDNCSDDGSTEVAEDYALRFSSKIRLIRTSSFLSQIANYNFALSCIAPDSTYCKVVQADDWIYPECLARMVALAESDRSIGIVSSYRIKANSVLGGPIPYTKTIITGREVCRLQLANAAFVFGTPTTVLYRTEMVRNNAPFYDEGSFFDDSDACYRMLRLYKFGFVHQVLSFSRVDDDSIRGRVLNFNPDALDRFLQIHKFGPVYLEKEELDRALENAQSDYYRLLGRRVLTERRRAFWKFHLYGLRSGGLRLAKALLAKHVCLELLSLLTNPGLTFTRIYHHLGLSTTKLRTKALARSAEHTGMSAAKWKASE